jgi:toxin ParE1/3/4
MAHKVVWSTEALQDIQEIADYISKDSEFYAAAVVRKIVGLTRQMAVFPYAGRVVPELDDDSIRERFAYSYRIIYRVGVDTVTVAAIIHGKRLLPHDVRP